jgi:hypothetical protein
LKMGRFLKTRYRDSLLGISASGMLGINTDSIHLYTHNLFLKKILEDLMILHEK